LPAEVPHHDACHHVATLELRATDAGPVRWAVMIESDTKSWTWVLEKPCPECGFEASGVQCQEVAGALRANAAAWPELLARPDVRFRPAPNRWSALEYGCHVRDVFRIFDRRLALMLEQDDPVFDNWDQDRTAVDERYSDQSPARIAGEIVDAGSALASRFDSVSGSAWTRTGTRSDGASFTVDSFSRYLLHDPIHHVHDVITGYESLSSTRAGHEH